MSHMSCKIPQRAAQHPPLGLGHRDTQRRCHTEAHGWKVLLLGPGASPHRPPPRLGPAPCCPPRCTPAGCGPAPAGSLGRRGSGGTWRRPAACWRRRRAGGTGCSSLHRARPPARAQEGGSRPRRGVGAQTCLPLSPSGRGHPELLPTSQPLTAVTPCTGSPAPMECAHGVGTTSTSSLIPAPGSG